MTYLLNIKNQQNSYSHEYIFINHHRPWTISLDINLNLQLPKKIYKFYFNEIIAQVQPHAQIYTNASITDQKVGAAIIFGDTEIQL